MGSKRSKISRGSKRSKVVSGEDRISNLPDSLLLVILSFLPFVSAVRTSVLSKRWRPLCMSLSNLCFTEFRGLKYRVHFNNFVDRLLMHRPVDLNIEKFGLQYQGDYDPSRINQWIRKALEHQVKDLSLGFCSDCGYELLPDIYTYGSFQTLRLGSRILVDIPNHVSFSRLKVLQFMFLTFSNYESIKELLLNCPVLEDLVIVGCDTLSGYCLTVCGSALKNLWLEYNEPVNYRDTPLEMVIATPGLETLLIRDSKWANIFIKGTFLSLRTAHIDVGVRQLEFNNSVLRLLDNIFHVRCLTLTDKAIGVLDCVCVSHYRFPTFHNLIQLELSVEYWSCWNLLPRIIASSPNLQCLLLPSGVDLTHTRRKCYGLWNMPKLVPECLSSNLKTIEIGIFHGTDDELSLVDYFLLEGKVLRKISICCKSRIRKDVLRLSSKTCKIHFI